MRCNIQHATNVNDHIRAATGKFEFVPFTNILRFLSKIQSFPTNIIPLDYFPFLNVLQENLPPQFLCVEHDTQSKPCRTVVKVVDTHPKNLRAPPKV